MINMKEKYGDWALITGASSGIGRSFAWYLAKEGINCILVAEDAPVLKEVRSAIESEYAVRIIDCCVDLGREGCVNAIKDTIKELPVSILINNASFGITGFFPNNPLTTYDEMINVNVKAYVNLTHAFLPAMVTRNRGALIYTSSLNVVSPIGGCAVYTATKAFEYYFGSALWYELKHTDIDVMVVLPGPTKTNFQKRAGTKISSLAMDPDTLVERALPMLGKKLVFIPDFRLKFLSCLSPLLPLKKRITSVSKGYRQALHDNPEKSLLGIIKNAMPWHKKAV
jgi:hypothetical protein